MSDIIRVFRVELGFSFLSKDGQLDVAHQGPYSTYQSIMSRLNGYKNLNLSTDDIINPVPEDDGLSLRVRYIYGFKSIAQMNAWFHADLLSLNEAGFVLAEYKVPKDMVSYGNRQLQFHREHSELIGMYNILDTINTEELTNPEYMDSVLEYFL